MEVKAQAASISVADPVGGKGLATKKKNISRKINQKMLWPLSSRGRSTKKKTFFASSLNEFKTENIYI